MVTQPARDILTVPLREGNNQERLGEQLEDDDAWRRTKKRRPRILEQRIARVVTKGTAIKADMGTECTEWVEKEKFSGKVPTLPEDSKAASEEAD